jgi:hypothetical protein
MTGKVLKLINQFFSGASMRKPIEVITAEYVQENLERHMSLLDLLAIGKGLNRRVL